MSHLDVSAKRKADEAEASSIKDVTPIWGQLLVRLSDFLDRLTEAAYVSTTAVFASVMLLGVFFRYVLNNSLSWSDELALILFAWATFLSVATAYLHNKHVHIDILVRMVSPRWQARIGVLAEGLAGAYLLCLLVSGLEALPVAARAQTSALQWPITVPYAAIPTACVLMLVHWMRRNLVGGASSTRIVKLAIVFGFFVLVYLPLGHYIQLSGAPRFLVLILTLFVPMLIGVPVAFALGLMSTMYVAVFGTIPFNTGALQVFYGTEILTLMAVPLLILAGTLMHEAGIAKRLVDFAQALVGRLRGGLGASNVLASLLFGDISGSAVADTAAIGSLMIPEMKRRGYRADFCAALQGASGTLGMTAPLSITLLLYCSAINVSVSRMAAAVIVPGLLLAGGFVLYAIIHGRRNKYPRENVSLKLILPRFLGALPAMFALILILAGVLGGVFTPAEVGSIVLAYVLLLSIVLYRTGRPKQLYRATVKAGYISGMTLFMLATAAFLGFVLMRDLVSVLIVDMFSQILTSKYLVLLGVNLIIVVLGMVLEGPAITFGFLPSLMPLMAHFGIDQVLFGVMFMINLGLGMIVPPVALNLFISTSIAEVRYDQAVRASVPFILIMMLNITIIAVFPQIALLLPHLIFDYPMP